MSQGSEHSHAVWLLLSINFAHDVLLPRICKYVHYSEEGHLDADEYVGKRNFNVSVGQELGLGDHARAVEDAQQLILPEAEKDDELDG